MSSAETEAPPRDERREQLLAQLQAELGDGLVESYIKPGDDLWVRVEASSWVQAAQVLRDKLGCDYFCFLSAIDWLPSPYGRGEDDPNEPPPVRDTTVQQGYAGGQTRFQLIARVYDVQEHIGVTLKCDVPGDPDELRMPTWTGVFRGADWHERETWEMFGIDFEGHPHLVHIYLPSDFEGHPLRKDYPLLARMVKPWPGIVDVEPLPGGGDEEAGDE